MQSSIRIGMCGSRKYPYPPHGRSMEIPRWGGGGGRVSTVIIYKGKYKAKLEFPGGGRVQEKKPSMGEVWIFLEQP